MEGGNVNTTFANAWHLLAHLFKHLSQRCPRRIFRELFARKKPSRTHLLAVLGHFLRAFCAPRRAKSSKDKVAGNKGNINKNSLSSIFIDFLRYTPHARLFWPVRERGSAKGARSLNRCAQPALRKETTPCFHLASSAASSVRATTATQPPAPETTSTTASRASAGSIRRRLVAFAAKGLTWNTTMASGPLSYPATGAGHSNPHRRRRTRTQRATLTQVAACPAQQSNVAAVPAHLFNLNRCDANHRASINRLIDASTLRRRSRHVGAGSHISRQAEQRYDRAKCGNVPNPLRKIRTYVNSVDKNRRGLCVVTMVPSCGYAMLTAWEWVRKLLFVCCSSEHCYIPYRK